MATNSSSGWLRGGEFYYDAPKPIHRLFEEMLESNSSNETVALTFKGKTIF